MFNTYIVTAPRPKGHCYLGQTLESYFTYFDTKPTIFAEPGSLTPIHHERCSWIWNPTTLGCFANIFATFKHYLEHSSEPYMMLCEDDIEFQPNVVEELMTLQNVTGYASLYCSEANRHKYPGVWHQARLPDSYKFCGNLCLLLPKSTVELLVQNETLCRAYAAQTVPDCTPLYVDYAISKFVTNVGLNILVFVPTLVLHLGEVSTWLPNNTKKARQWVFRQPAL